MPITIRPADPDDAPDLLRLLRLAVPPAVRPGTPLGPWAAQIWIQDRITEASQRGAVETNEDGTQPGVPSPCAYRVAVAERRIVGAAEWRDLGGALFLNSIAVDPLARGRGAGTQLLCDGIRTWPSLPVLQLDVFDAMPQARQWYNRIGCSDTGKRTWIRFPPRSSAERGADAALSVTWNNEADATSRHRQHGCSMLHLHVASSTKTGDGGPQVHTVGRIGRSMFRITNRRTLRHAAIRAFLHRLNPSRHLLYISSPRSQPLPESKSLTEPTRTDQPVSPDAVVAKTFTDPLTGARGTHLATSIRMHHTSPLDICA